MEMVTEKRMDISQRRPKKYLKSQVGPINRFSFKNINFTKTINLHTQILINIYIIT